jgi:hypothetical protein
MVKRCPQKIDIGAVYNARPTEHKKLNNFRQQILPLELHPVAPCWTEIFLLKKTVRIFTCYCCLSLI